MRSTMFNLWPIFAGVAILITGNGLQGTLLGVRGGLEGFSTFTIGTIMSCYSVGYLLGSVVAQRLVRDVGHIRVYAAMAALASVSVLLHAIFPHPALWMLIRAMTGFCFAALYIVIESWINAAATPSTRGKILALYLFTFYGALGAGQLLLNVADPGGPVPFMIVAMLICLSLLPVSLSKRPAPDYESPKLTGLRELIRISPLGFAGVFVSGTTVSCLTGMGAVYAAAEGLDVGEISLFMAAIVFGGMSFQLPMGWLSDRLERRRVLTACTAFSALFAGLCFFAVSLSFFALLAAAFILSGFAMSIYSLAVAHTNDHLEVSQIVSASAANILVNGAGAIFGPFLVSAFMGWFGPDSYFLFIAFFFAILTVFALYRATVRGPVPKADQSGYVGVPDSTTQVMARMAKQVILEKKS